MTPAEGRWLVGRRKLVRQRHAHCGRPPNRTSPERHRRLRLQERYGLFVAAVIVGLAWAAFHWVVLLANPESPLAYVAVSTLLLTAMSVIITYVFDDARQAVVIAVLMHAVYDTVSVGMVPLVETGVPLLAFGLSAGVAWALALAIVAAARLRAEERGRLGAARA